MKTRILAAAQISCRDGDIEGNLEHASIFAEQASQQGVHLLLFPEFLAQGYRLTSELWDAAEPYDGPTTCWLCHTARSQNMYVGASFLEVKNGHFLNTFVLADPSGKLVGAVRMWQAKAVPPEAGAPDVLFPLVAPELAGKTGKYFVEGKEAQSSPESYKLKDAQRLWEISERLVGQSFEFARHLSG